MPSTVLRCPESGRPLVPLDAAERDALRPTLHARSGCLFSEPDWILVRDDGQAAFPVVAGVPVLLSPEMLSARPRTWNLADPRWAEAYLEMPFYDASADSDASGAVSPRLLAQFDAYRSAGPFPSEGWIDATYDAVAQLEAYQHLGDPRGRVFAQVGGQGHHVVKALMAGADSGWLVTPMFEEARSATALAKAMGVGDRLMTVMAIAEELPLEPESLDSIYMGGCLHHVDARFAAARLHRVLKPGGRFAAVEPWRTRLHAIGTSVLGKREANAYCRPLDDNRLAPMRDAFPTLQVRSHGRLLRYLALGASKLSGRSMRTPTGLRLGRLDDRIMPSRVPGGSVAILAQRD